MYLVIGGVGSTPKTKLTHEKMQKLELLCFLLKTLSKHLGLHIVMIELLAGDLIQSIDRLLLLGLIRDEKLANMRVEDPLLLCGGLLLGRNAQV
jgi:hypothetical protein